MFDVCQYYAIAPQEKLKQQQQQVPGHVIYLYSKTKSPLIGYIMLLSYHHSVVVKRHISMLTRPK